MPDDEKSGMDLYDELLKLVLAYSNKQITYLARWIIDYRKRSDRRDADLRLSRSLYLRTFDRMVDEWELLRGKDKSDRQDGLLDFYMASIQPMIPNRYRYDIDELCNRGRWREAAGAIADIDREIEASQFESEYERLVTDTEYLIEQLVGVMKSEFSKRLGNTREAINEYVDPHRAILRRLDEDLLEANEGLRKIGASELAQGDKFEIETRLHSRIGELEAIRSDEIEKIREIEAFVNEVKHSYSAFKRIIASIEKERDLIEERRGYAGLLGKLESEAGELGRLFGCLNAELDANIKRAKESMEMLSGAFGGDFVDVIGDQEKLNRMLEGEEFAETRARRHEERHGHDYYEDILKMLKSMGA
ncbi:MAG: hypothetical protein M0Z80_08135 [Treponema sp.]|nr:hypothetical protein [Treponema sp.]